MYHRGLLVAEASVQINKQGLLYRLPSVAAYVDSDVVASVLATRIYAKKNFLSLPITIAYEENL